jgi:hypothetical protein
MMGHWDIGTWEYGTAFTFNFKFPNLGLFWTFGSFIIEASSMYDKVQPIRNLRGPHLLFFDVAESYSYKLLFFLVWFNIFSLIWMIVSLCV